MYTEVIVFCAQSIVFFRNNPKVDKTHHAWTRFSSNFSKAISNLHYYFGIFDTKVDMIRLSRETKPPDTVKEMN